MPKMHVHMHVDMSEGMIKRLQAEILVHGRFLDCVQAHFTEPKWAELKT